MCEYGLGSKKGPASLELSASVGGSINWIGEMRPAKRLEDHGQQPAYQDTKAGLESDEQVYIHMINLTFWDWLSPLSYSITF